MGTAVSLVFIPIPVPFSIQRFVELVFTDNLEKKYQSVMCGLLITACMHIECVVGTSVGCIISLCSSGQYVSAKITVQKKVGGPFWLKCARSSWYRWNQYWFEPCTLAAYLWSRFIRFSELRLFTMARGSSTDKLASPGLWRYFGLRN